SPPSGWSPSWKGSRQRSENAALALRRHDCSADRAPRRNPPRPHRGLPPPPRGRPPPPPAGFATDAERDSLRRSRQGGRSRPGPELASGPLDPVRRGLSDRDRGHSPAAQAYRSPQHGSDPAAPAQPRRSAAGLVDGAGGRGGLDRDRPALTP